MSDSYGNTASSTYQAIVRSIMNEDMIYGSRSSYDRRPHQPVVESQYSSSQTVRPLMGADATGLYEYGREMDTTPGVTQSAVQNYHYALLKSVSDLAKTEYGLDISELVSRSVHGETLKRTTSENINPMKRSRVESAYRSRETSRVDLNSLDLGPAKKLQMGVRRVIALLRVEANEKRLTDPRLLSKVVHGSNTGLQIIYSVEPSTIVDNEFHGNVYLGRLHIGAATAQTTAWVKKRAFDNAINTLLNTPFRVILKRVRKRAIPTKKQKIGEGMEEDDDGEEEEDIPADISVKFDTLCSRICKSKYDATSVVKLLDGYTIQSFLTPVSYYSKTCKGTDGDERFHCDLCIDDVSVSAGEGTDMKSAQMNSYIQAWERFTTEYVDQILESSSRMTEQMKHDPKYVEVFQKGQKEFTWSNTVLLESIHPEGANLARPLLYLVILETEEWAREGAFSVLNNSAANCGLLMEWVFQKDKHNHSRCHIYIQKQQLGTAKDVLRYKAREQAAMNALKELYEHQDFIQECPQDDSQVWYSWDRLQVDSRMAESVLDADTISEDEYEQIMHKKEAVYACNVVQEFFFDDSNDLKECVFDPYMPLAEQQFIMYYVTVFLGLEVKQKTHTDGHLYLVVSKGLPLPDIARILQESDTKSVGRYCFLNPDGVTSGAYTSLLINTNPQIQSQEQTHPQVHTQAHTQHQAQTPHQAQSHTQHQAQTPHQAHAQHQAHTPHQAQAQTPHEAQAHTQHQAHTPHQAQTSHQAQAQTPHEAQAHTQHQTHTPHRAHTPHQAQAHSQHQAQTPHQAHTPHQAQAHTPHQTQTPHQAQGKTRHQTQAQTPHQSQTLHQAQTPHQAQAHTQAQTQPLHQAQAHTQHQTHTQHQALMWHQAQTPHQEQTHTQYQTHTRHQTQAQIPPQVQTQHWEQTELRVRTEHWALTEHRAQTQALAIKKNKDTVTALHVEKIMRPIAVQDTNPSISAQIVQLPDLRQQLMESPPIEEISEKLKTLTKGILWFTNLHDVNQMFGMFVESDLKRPLSELILIEYEGSANQLNSAFINLRTSSSKCGILIDWSVEKKDQQYDCCVYMQKHLFSRGRSYTKAMDACLEAFYSAVVNLYKTNPVIQITSTVPTRITWQELEDEAGDWEPETMDKVCLSYDDSTEPLKYRTETMYTCAIVRDFFQDRDKRYEELELKDIPFEVETIVRKYAQSELRCCHRKKRVARSFLYQYFLMSSPKDLLQAVQRSKTGQVGRYRLLSTDELLRGASQQSSSDRGNAYKEEG